MALVSGILTHSVSKVNQFLFLPTIQLSVRNYAARKGTRERKKKQKVKGEEEKKVFIPHNQRNREKLEASRPKRFMYDLNMNLPIDNVYQFLYYKWKEYPFEEAIQCHRETHHPDIYNKPNAPVQVHMELNMQGEKKTRFIDGFTRIAPMAHKFDHGEERTVIVFSKDREQQEEARKAGAQLAGGVELIKEIQNGSIALSDFQHCVAHPNIMPELVVLRGVMKRKFPNPRSGTLDVDLGDAVTKIVSGVTYSAVVDQYEKEFATIQTLIGSLNMDVKSLEENFVCLLDSINISKPKREGKFITKCFFLSPPSREKVKVDLGKYLEEEVKGDESEGEEDDVAPRAAVESV